MANPANAVRQSYPVKGGTIQLAVNTVHPLSKEEIKSLELITSQCVAYAQKWAPDKAEVKKLRGLPPDDKGKAS